MTFTWWRLAKNIMTSRKKRAAKEKAKEAAKPEEETVNERNEYFVLLVDVLDAEHDPQMTVLPMMEYREEKEEGWRVWDILVDNGCCSMTCKRSLSSVFLDDKPIRRQPDYEPPRKVSQNF
ncbi:unnamed protein product [Brassica napus]|uniref:(rape) hypothetical protein n=1 Tax=Brassica napus TaxID=3708 RepID=A0A817A252_BRANA|nr:unnamed protein product [Brassica napus]